MCSHCVRASCDFSCGPSGAGRGKTVQRLRGDCTEIVRIPCEGRAIVPRAVRFLFGPNVHLKSCVFCTISVRPPRGGRAGIVQHVQYHLRHVYGLRAYDFSTLSNFSLLQNRRGCGARESVRFRTISHGRLLPPYGGRTKRRIRAGYGLRRSIVGHM